MKHLFLTLAVACLVKGQAPLDPANSAWRTAPATALALHRTPPLYSTEAPPVAEITAVEMRVLRLTGKTFVRLEWRDRSHDSGEPSPDRFFDACAVMLPARPVVADVYPSLQMGDGDHPVVIYYVDTVRGASVMEAAGRGTTKRTGKTFLSRSVYTSGIWQATLELPEIATGMPFSVAVWNGGQQDRDGRKYFSIWHPIP